MATALLLIDLQNDYFPGGKMELEGSLEASLRAREILTFSREKGWPLVHIQHIAARPGATFFLPGTEGVKIHQHVEPLPGEVIFPKNYPNSFRNTPLLDHLINQQVGKIVVCGMMTHMCVDATVRAAFDYGFNVTVVHDACATRDLTFGDQTIPATQVHGAFLAALGFIYAKVVSTADFLRNFR
ncbi:MAG: cysteine hydrolase family protein [Syntrophales bacterium]|nr:cysteine hydrolase family protein [Syntrophales bacterium]MDD5641575.1 cysteine hydrolase family protein [Syntrophales bacterium]